MLLPILIGVLHGDLKVESHMCQLIHMLIHNCTIFLCSLDVGNIDDQRRGPTLKEKDHRAGELTAEKAE